MGKDFVIGVDLGGTNLRVASYISGAAPAETISLGTRLAAGPDEVVRDMCEAIQVLSKNSYEEARFGESIGVGVPGPLELPAGILRNLPTRLEWLQSRRSYSTKAEYGSVIGE